MKPKSRYIVLALETDHNLLMMGREVKFPLIWTDQMCGVLPVFSTKKAAISYAGKDYKIMQVKVETKVETKVEP